MRSPRTPSIAVVAAAALAVVPGLAAAQTEFTDTGTQFSPISQGVGAFLLTLVVGGILVAAAPNYLDRTIGRVQDSPVGSFLVGIVALVLFVVVAVVLALTGIGIIILIPLALVFIVVAILGNAIAYLAVFDGLLDDRWGALVAAAVVAGVLAALPILGDVVGFIVGSIGVGAIINDFRR